MSVDESEDWGFGSRVFWVSVIELCGACGWFLLSEEDILGFTELGERFEF